MQEVTLESAETRLRQLVQSVLAGEEVRIAVDDARFVRLTPEAKSSPSENKRQLGRSKGLILYMADDFDAPLEDFKEYMK